MSDIGSLSILTGALGRLLNGTLSGVMTVGPIPLAQLLTAAEYDENEAILQENISNNKFTIAKDFDLETLKSFLMQR
jgi:hypothetical protein